MIPRPRDHEGLPLEGPETPSAIPASLATRIAGAQRAIVSTLTQMGDLLAKLSDEVGRQQSHLDELSKHPETVKVVTDPSQLAGGAGIMTDEEWRAFDKTLATCRGRVDTDDVTRYGDILHRAAHGGNETGCYPQMCRQFESYAEVLLAALTRDGRLLPADARASVEYGVRVMRGDTVENEWATDLARACAVADYHDKKREENADWPTSAVVLRRTVTAWEEHPQP